MTRTLAYKFRLRPTRRQTREMDRFCGAARYAWNWGLAEYERALDETRAGVPDEDGKRATGSVRDILERRMHERGVTVARRGAGNVDSTRTLSLKSVIYALWRHHRDTESPPWAREGVHSHVHSYALQRLCDTASKWWQAKGKRTPWVTASERRAGKKKRRGPGARGSQGRLVGAPRYKRRDDNPSFTIQASSRSWDRLRVTVPGGVGPVLVEDARRGESPSTRIPEGAVAKVVTVRKIADYWEVSVTVTEPWVTPGPEPGPACGIDLGMNAEATIAWSDGRIERIEPPRPMASLGVRLVLLQRKLSASRHVLRCLDCRNETPLGERDKRIRVCREQVERDGATVECGGRLRRWRSIRGIRLQMRLAKLHDHISRVRNDHLHRFSFRLATEASVICTEPHNVTGLVSAGVARRCERYFHKGLARRDIRRAMLDIGWGEFRRQTKYKAVWKDKVYETLPAGTATDKTCHRCGHSNVVPDGTSEYACAGCGWLGTRQENTSLLCLGHVTAPRDAQEAAE